MFRQKHRKSKKKVRRKSNPISFSFLSQSFNATGLQLANAYETQSIGAIIAPFIIGLIADRYFSAQKILGFLHLIGSFLLYMAGSSNEFSSFYPFVLFYMILYIFFPKVAHRMVGYFEEQAVISYSSYLKAIELGKIDNIPAPKIAINYYGLPEDARLKEVVVAVREDEKGHSKVNHDMADTLEIENGR